MRARGLVVGTAVALVPLAVVLAVARGGGPRSGEARATPGQRPAPPVETPSPVALEGLRDIFRFADEVGASRPAEAELVSEDSAPLEPVPAPGPRLVGLIRRSGRLLAALAVDGEVVLAGAGDSVGDVSVVSVDDESVRLRLVDGSESTLVSP